MYKEWENFNPGIWTREINVRDFIQKNYTPYEGDDSFLANATDSTKELWKQVMDLTAQERAKGGVLDMDTDIISSITSHPAGYLNKKLETMFSCSDSRSITALIMKIDTTTQRYHEYKKRIIKKRMIPNF